MAMRQVDFDLNLKFSIYEDVLRDSEVIVRVDYNEVREFQCYYWRFSREDTEDNYDSIERIEDVGCK